MSLAEPDGTHSTTSYNTGSPSLEVEVEPEAGKKEKTTRTNVLFGSGTWLSKYQGTFETIAKDPGIGVSATKLEYENAATKVWEPLVEHSYLESGDCKGIQCYPEHGETWTLPNRLPNGEDKIRYRAEDAMAGTRSLESEGVTTVKVDTSPPHNLGLTGLPLGGELRQTEYQVEAHATEGEGSTPNPGVKSIALFINGRLNAESAAECNGSHGECTASAHFAIKGEQLALGPNDVAIQATDGAGNVSKPLRYTLTVRQSTPVALGPGSLDLESGDFTLASTDVSMGQGLSVSRTYSSRALTAGIQGPLGPQWNFSIANDESLTEVFGGSMMLTSANGKEAIFAFNSEKHVFEPPPGDSNLELIPEEVGEGKEKHIVAYVLKDPAAKTAVEFTQPTGEGSWVPTEQDGPVATDTVIYRYKTTEVEVEGQKKKVAEPLEAVAPTPTGVECRSGALERGCRGLTFEYASETNSSSGEYKGRLMRVFFTAWNPAEGKMSKPVAVAQYEYDSQGRLRAEWDPRVSPALKTTYGYDEEGHVTALTPPGQEPWVFTYGTIAHDSGTGSLIKVTRAPASTPLKTREPPKNTEPPKLSGQAMAKMTMTASPGAWSNEPVAYGFQWEDCNSEGASCTPILGATNASYTTTDTDAGRTLVVVVRAMNQAGAIAASSTPSAIVALGPTYPLSEGSQPGQIISGPDGNLWFTNASKSNPSIDKITPSGAITSYATKNASPTSITQGPEGDFWFNGLYDAIGKITPTGTITEFALPNPSTVRQLTAGPEGDIWYTDYAVQSGKLCCSAIDKMTTAGAVTEYPLPVPPGGGSISFPTGITMGPDGNAWYSTESFGSNCVYGPICGGPSFVGKITPSGAITQYEVPGEATSIVTGPDRNLWFTTLSGVDKITPAGVITGYQPTMLKSESRGIAVGPEGDIWFVGGGLGESENVVGRVTTTGELAEYLAPNGNLESMTRGPDGNMWYTNTTGTNEKGTSQIGVVNLKEAEATTGTPQPGTTIEYHVPISGAGAPHEMSESAVSAWAQQDDPVEATAIIAPDEPQGWPASSYKRATIYYLDEEGHTVNVATPSNSPHGSISTTEYNEQNEPIRTLSPDNRETALQAGTNSEEVSRRLDTRDVYNGEGTQESKAPEQGTRLIETLGPQHEIRYKEGKGQKESLARERTEYFYDQGAPGGESTAREGETYQQKPGAERYDLLTESSTVAQLENRERREVRTTKTSYSGQGGVGWNLRAPTSTTNTVNGTSLTTTTEYNEATGQIVAKKTPLGSAATSATASYVTTFTANISSYEFEGKEAKFSEPNAVAVDPRGNVWVADSATDRIVEYSSALKFTREFGKEGTGEGQFKGIAGIAANSSGDVYVSDVGNHRVQEFGPSGEHLRSFGSLGTGNGQFSSIGAITVDPQGNVWVLNVDAFVGHEVQEFSPSGEYESGFGAFLDPVLSPTGLAFSGANLYVTEASSGRVVELSSTGEVLKQFGSLDKPSGIATDPSTGNLYVSELGTNGLHYIESKKEFAYEHTNNRIQEFSPSGTFITAFGSYGSGSGQFSSPRGVAMSSSHKLYVADTGNQRVQEWSTVRPGVHTSQIVYYTPKSEANVSECQNHPEWAGLPCLTKPAEQPETPGVPNLPVTKTTYNIWDEPVEAVETFSSKERGTTERIKRQTYDEAGRLKTSETKSSTAEDAAVPKVEDTYSSESGLLIEQSTPSNGKVASKFNTLGQLESYSDADGNTAKYSYEEPDDLVKEVRDSSNKGETYQRYSYDPTTKELTELEDSGAGTFTATYDAEGKMTSEVYPNQMCANTTYNSVGQAIHLQYIKTANCSEEHPKVWYNDEIVPSIHGETLSQTSTLSSEEYTYDEAARLTSVQETPAGQHCKTRLYEYDEESNRIGETQAEPNSKGECSTEGAQEHHLYDEANRLVDPGVTYDAFGNTTALPATDAGGQALKSTFYVDNQVATQTQNGKAIAYGLDPTGRVRETTCASETTLCEGGKSSKVISHYDGPGEAVAWTSEGGAETRNIPGIDGTLCGVEKHGEAAVLQLHDLQGDIVATASLSPSATELASTYNSTEFGVPSEGKAPPKYAWLGATGVSTELSSGVVTDGAVSYVPQTGRTLQTEQVEPPGLAYGSGAGKPYTAQAEPWVWQGAARNGAEAPGLEATREREAAEAACRANPAACLRFEDPAPHVTYLTMSEARNYIANVRGATEIGSEAKFVQFFFDLPGYIVDAVEEIFTGGDAEKWDEALAGKLEQCVSGLISSHHKGGGCRVSQAETTFFHECIWIGLAEKEYCIGGITVPNISVPAEVSECWGWKPNGHLAWCYYLGP
ncbi:MAG TPA: SMP-30/gluconolactonase/LRE family protein [Acidimicrobiales bacterium]|nr:SMP-30/gluconolactonase/LRE family protein [Acidimicrobiales bacterium]